MYKTRRQERYLRLREAGLLPFEARPLSKVPWAKAPYMKNLLKDRQRIVQEARQKRLTTRQYEDLIKKLYWQNNYTSIDRLGHAKLDPWSFFRTYEDTYMAKHPEHTSPWVKRQKNWLEAISKIENSLKKERSHG